MRRMVFRWVPLCLVLVSGQIAGADDAGLEFFEKQVRPLLVKRCYECHSATAKRLEGGLRLDGRELAMKGGDTGPAVVPGKLKESLLIDAINYGETYQMPPKSKMPAEEIAILTKWVEQGAVWPKDEKQGGAGEGKAFDLAERKAAHWSWKPIQPVEPPSVKNAAWAQQPLDRFILAKVEAQGFTPAKPADSATLLRRLYFDVIGLPPSEVEVREFVADADKDRRGAIERAIDRLLALPQFGERWGRHWLDLVRYAESRGHEFDYNAANAYQYRDYVIRALNADVPYDQFVIEHVAGDLVSPPRRNPQAGFNESILGTGFWFLGEWVHSPVDIRKDETDRFDNMVDVFSKTFLGLTVACARCHDHKFDAISQKDYYALFGYLQSSGHRLARFDTLDEEQAIAADLAKLDAQFRPRFAKAVVDASRPEVAKLANYFRAAGDIIRGGVEFEKPAEIVFEDFESGAYTGWTVEGAAFGDKPQTQATIGVYQGNVKAVGKFFVNSHNIRGGQEPPKGDDHVGRMLSRKFKIERPSISFRIGGGAHAGKTCMNLLVDGKEVLSATGKNNNEMEPALWDVQKWRGAEAQLEIVDQQTGGWGNIGVDHIVFTDQPAKAVAMPLEKLAGATQRRVADMAKAQQLSPDVLEAWVVRLEHSKSRPQDPLHTWGLIAAAKDADATKIFAARREAALANGRAGEGGADLQTVVDYAAVLPGQWLQDGVTFGAAPVPAGQLLLGTQPEQPLVGVATYGAARRDATWNNLKLAPGAELEPGRLSYQRSGKTLRTPTFDVGKGLVHYLVQGAGTVYASVDSHATIVGPLHGQIVKETGGDGATPPRWITHDLRAYVGHRPHLEFTPKDEQDFQVIKVVVGDQPPPLPSSGDPVALVQGDNVEPATALQRLFEQTLERLSANSWPADTAPAWAELANTVVTQPQLFFAAGKSDAVNAVAGDYFAAREKIAARIPRESRLALAMWEGSGEDEHLLIRGNTKTVGPIVPRRMLTAIVEDLGENSGAGEGGAGSGRLALAKQLVDPRNPFTARVMVNRIWHHLLGRGIVPTTDNLGVLGQEPTHPELLDWLAQDFRAGDGGQGAWSVKRIIKRILLSRTYQQTSDLADVATEERDPNNLLWRRQMVKRLEGEVIRDSLLAISGRLDKTQFGPSVPIYLGSFLQGRGRPGDGPLDGNGRRSIYLSVRRNFLAPMMLAFDTPIPFSTVGRRNVSNVPAQALMLMNDPFVLDQMKLWAKRTLAEPNLSPHQRLSQMYFAAYGRAPREAEAAASLEFLSDQGREYGLPADAATTDLRPWADLAHVLVNGKEFVFVR